MMFGLSSHRPNLSTDHLGRYHGPRGGPSQARCRQGPRLRLLSSLTSECGRRRYQEGKRGKGREVSLGLGAQRGVRPVELGCGGTFAGSPCRLAGSSLRCRQRELWLCSFLYLQSGLSYHHFALCCEVLLSGSSGLFSFPVAPFSASEAAGCKQLDLPALQWPSRPPCSRSRLLPMLQDRFLAPRRRPHRPEPRAPCPSRRAPPSS